MRAGIEIAGPAKSLQEVVRLFVLVPPKSRTPEVAIEALKTMASIGSVPVHITGCHFVDGRPKAREAEGS